MKADGITQAQCEALQREMSKTGGRLTPAAIEALKRNPEFKDVRFEGAERWREPLEKREGRTEKGGNTEGKPAAPPGPDSAETEGSLFDRYMAPATHTEVSTRLKPFGYDLFAGVSLAPPQNLPVASDYIIGPGDEVSLLLWGRVNGQYNPAVGRDGTIFVPNVGALSVAGMTFEEMRAYLKKHTKNIIGAEINVSMGRLRAIQVFVLGEVRRPGAYTVSAMSTLTNAMIAAGGATGTGTLRNVELKRGSGTITVMDFYDLLLRGDKSKDSRLQNNDVIFVPVVGPLVGIAGNVKRPGVYEVKDEAALASALELAGGIIPTAFTQQIQVERIERNERRIVIDVDAKESAGAKTFNLQDGDMVKVYPIVEKDVNAVYLYGNVKRPGKYELKQGMRLKDIIRDESYLLDETYLEYGLIKRLAPPTNEVKLIVFNPGNILSNGAAEDNITLAPRDAVYIFSKWFFKDKPSVSIEGEVRCAHESIDGKAADGQNVPREAGAALSKPFPRDKEKRHMAKGCSFELQRDSTVKDLVLMAGGAGADASHEEFELYRTEPVTKEVTLLKFNLGKAMAGGLPDNAKLMDSDRVVIHSVWEKTAMRFVMVSGEVNRPGQYPYAVNMTVKDAVFAAGNLSESAYTDEAELASAVIKEGKSFYVDYRKVNLRTAMQGDAQSNIPLKSHDALFIKRIPDWKEQMYAELKGEVVFPGRYIIKKNETLSSLIERAGGFTEKAYLKGAAYSRKSLKALQQRNIDESLNRFEQEMLLQSASVMQAALTPEDAKQLQATFEQRKALLAKMRAARAEGRVSIKLDVPERLRGTSYDMALEDGDVLNVPERPGHVQVVGSVYNQTALIYNPNAAVSSYVKKAGGMTKGADEREMYILKADGTAVSSRDGGGSWLRWDSENNGWVGGFMSARLDPGDTIVVPENIEKIAWLKEVKDLTQILYQIAVTAGVLIVAF
ncbi:MAG: SLBB domain-containing protein [Deltaproteobacteria bacterium]|nr:SLBB domain-containing protein [Deltaproteobacteria bacterium]